MSAPLPLRNPYANGAFGRYGALSPTGQDIAHASWEEGARAVIARLRAFDADTPIVWATDEIQVELEYELKGER